MSLCDHARTGELFSTLAEILSQVPLDHPVAVGVQLPSPGHGPGHHDAAGPLDDWAITAAGEPDGRPTVQLAFRQLPCDDIVHALAGFVAPPRWCGFGIVAPGQAHHVDRLDDQTVPVTLSVLMDRTGMVTSFVRDAQGHRLVAPAGQSGRVVDACRRVLGLATAPATISIATWATLSWLDTVLARTIDADLGEPPTWPELAVLEPLEVGQLRDGVGTSWSTARQACADGSLVSWAVSAEAAAWMDDAMFSREAVQAYPPLIETLIDLRSLLAPTTFELLVERISDDLAR